MQDDEIFRAVFREVSGKEPELCRGPKFEIDKGRIWNRLTALYSEERKDYTGLW